MYRPISCIAILSTVLACTVSAPVLDSNSLSGWIATGDANWLAEDGELLASGQGDGFLASAQTFDNFHLTVEFRVDATVNSGVFIRCQDRDNIHPNTCYEFNIWDEHPQQEARTGSIVFRAMPPLVHVETLGRWNTYEITANGSSLEARVNGELTAVLEDSQLTSGFIALQHLGRWERSVSGPGVQAAIAPETVFSEHGITGPSRSGLIKPQHVYTSLLLPEIVLSGVFSAVCCSG